MTGKSVTWIQIVAKTPHIITAHTPMIMWLIGILYEISKCAGTYQGSFPILEIVVVELLGPV